MVKNLYKNEIINTILDVALDLFMEKGYESTNVQDIIDCLDGNAKNSIYLYFKSKEDILIAITDRVTTIESNQMLEAV